MKIVKPSVTLKGLHLPVHHDGWGIDQDGAKVPEQIIEFAGRVCYKSEDKITDDSYINFVDKVCNQLHHESVMEHSYATFHMVMDRGISHEAVRHRIASFSQESTRYCNYSKDKFGQEITVIEPPGLGDVDSPAHVAWVDAVRQAERSYFRMLDAGCTPQIARSVLPTCLKTELVMSANFREWKHFLKLRTAPAAHPQMREIAKMVQDILVNVAPVIFKSDTSDK